MLALPSQAGVGFQAQGGLLVVLAAVAGALLLVIACAVVWFLRGRR